MTAFNIPNIWQYPDQTPVPGNNEVALFVVLIAISNIVEEGFMGLEENEGCGHISKRGY